MFRNRFRVVLRKRLPVLISAQAGYIFFAEWSFNLSDFVILCSHFRSEIFNLVSVFDVKVIRKVCRVVITRRASFHNSEKYFVIFFPIQRGCLPYFLSECSLCSPIRVHNRRRSGHQDAHRLIEMLHLHFEFRRDLFP